MTRDYTQKAYRSLLCVEQVRGAGPNGVVDVIVLNWDPHQVVHIPLDLVPAALRAQVVGGVHLWADVPVGAETADDLSFANITLAPEPDPNDGLG